MGQYKQVLADIETMDSFSAHGDRGEMADFLNNQKGTCQKIWLVHGTLDRQEKWRDYLLEKVFKAVDIPVLGKWWIFKSRPFFSIGTRIKRIKTRI